MIVRSGTETEGLNSRSEGRKNEVVAKVLVVEDDALLRDMVVRWLSSENHNVESSADGQDARQRLGQYSYDIAILDIDLPFVSGYQLCSEIRAKHASTLVLMLTQKDALTDKVEGFERGADDYLTKPFELIELSLRVKALLKRGRERQDNGMVAGNLRLNRDTFEVRSAGKLIELSESEFALLEFFVKHENQIFSLDALLNRVWTSDSTGTADGVRVCITRLRKKIDTPEHSYIKNVHGVGYKFCSAE